MSVAVPANDFRIGFGCFITFCMLLAVFGNLLTITAFYKYSSLRTVSNMYLINLCLSDLMMGVFTQLSVFISLIRNKQHYFFNCHISGTVDQTLLFTSLWTLTFNSCDRAYAITFPLRYYSQVTKKNSIIKCGIAWFLGFIISLPPLFGWNGYVYSSFAYSCAFNLLAGGINRYYYVYISVLGILIPIILVIISYTIITVNIANVENKLRNVRVSFKNVPAVGNVSVNQIHSQTWLVFVIIMAYLICNLPALSFGAFEWFGVSVPIQLHILGGCLLFANPSLNPVVYGLCNHKFRYAYKQLMRCKTPRADNQAKFLESMRKSLSGPVYRRANSSTIITTMANSSEVQRRVTVAL